MWVIPPHHVEGGHDRPLSPHRVTENLKLSVWILGTNPSDSPNSAKPRHPPHGKRPDLNKLVKLSLPLESRVLTTSKEDTIVPFPPAAISA